MNCKILFLQICFSLMATIVSSQKYDFNWLIGYSSVPKKDSVEGHTMLNFNTNSGQLEFKFDKNKNIEFFGGNALSLSSKEGNYLMSFNGFIIEDSFGNKVVNSDSICYYDECWASLQQSLILPYPNKGSSFILITIHDEWFMEPISLRGGLVSYIPIIINENNKITLTQKKITLTKDTFDLSKISACKHANGRDWWILVPEDSINTFHTYLFNSNGIQLHFKQKVSNNFRFNGEGISTFSPNGNYFAIAASSNYVVNPKGSINFYNFDRCNGLLSNYQNVIFSSYQSIDYELFASGAFSSNSKYYYACESDSLYQYPISEDGILGERILIDVYDGFRSHLFGNNYAPTKFRQLQLAPDGKIYCNPTWLQTREYGVINKPNNPGKACDFRQHSLRMPALKYTSPTFPNYRLGPIDGSSCDTLGIDNIPWCWWRYDQDTSKPLCFEFTDLSAYQVAEWYWDFGDGTQSSDTSPVHCFPKNGVYEVCLIVKNLNGADTLCRTLNIGISETKYNEQYEIQTELFPNPATDYFILNIVDYIPEHMNLNLFNSVGIEVLSQRVFQGSNIIDLELIPSGLYLVQIKDRNGIMKTEKLMVEY